MDLRSIVKNLFGPRECRGCEAHRDHIASLREEVVDLRSEKDNLRENLFRITRIQVEPVEAKAEKSRLDPVQTRVAKSWHQLQRELEQKHKKKPDDQKEEYWSKKATEMEAQAKLMTSEEAIHVE